MKPSEYLKQEEIQLPIAFESTNFLSTLRSLFLRYNLIIERIRDLDPQLLLSSDDQEKIRLIEGNILKAVEAIYNGFSSKAYRLISECLDAASAEFNNFSSIDKLGSSRIFERLFRLRRSTEMISSRKDIYHVPFSQRRKVHSYRFSVPGLPALYLGTSLYICWEEMERPLLDDVYAARFQFKENQSFSFLHFWMTPLVVQEFLRGIAEEVLDDSIASRVFVKTFKSMTILWPLIASCHVKALQPNLDFKPEYIIPQLVTQYISEKENYDGVIYFSTKVRAYGAPAVYCRNIVLLAKASSDAEELSKNLVQKVHCTEPLSVRLFRATTCAGLGSADSPYFSVANGIDVQYSGTEFGRIESALSSMPIGSAECFNLTP